MTSELTAAHGLPTLFTAVAYYIIGSLLIYVAGKLWLTHPVNRAFILGPYLTEKGARLLMQSWPLVPLFGLFIFSCAAEHHLNWLYSHGNPELSELVKFMGWVEAGIADITALILLYLVVHCIMRRGGGPCPKV